MLAEFQSRWNLGLIALVSAWLLVLGLLGTAIGYVAYQRLSHETPETQMASAETDGESESEEAPPEAEEGRAAAPDGVEAAGPQDAATPEPDTAVKVDRAAEGTATPADAVQSEVNAAEAEAGEAGAGVEASAEAVEAVVSEEELPEGATPSRTAATGDGQDDAAQEGADAAQQEAALPPAGEPPWQHYAIPFDNEKAGPRIAVVMAGLGLSAAATEAAIKQLPPTVTLSFSPYARLLNQWIALARVNGHEVMLDLPMEPVTDDDPGPHALMTVLDRAQNLKRLEWLLKRGNSYVGVAGMMGSRFAASQEHMEPILENLNERGLLFLDNRATEESTASALAQNLGLPHVVSDRTLDAAQASRLAINARLSEIERLARENGAAVAMAQPYPVTIERLRDWAVDIESRGFVLTPITALAVYNP